MKSKATDCGSISTVFSSIVLLCVSSVRIINEKQKGNGLKMLCSKMIRNLMFKIAKEMVRTNQGMVQKK